MSDPLLTKRLHISGLTPSLTPADLERRLSSFGNVKTMDGFGAPDGLGDQRKFGFVTMDISAKALERCLNALSGTTWKGAKLRIGEAKPDFRERIARMNAEPPRPVRQKRTRTRNYGYPSPTLSLAPLSITAAASTPGWVVTPSGRVVRPMRMRPERPLEPIRTELGVKGNGKVKTRVKPPPIRARRRLIDPTKWDSVYLKGMFLDAVPVTLPTSKAAPESPVLVERDATCEESEGTEDGSTDRDSSDIIQREARPSPSSVCDTASTVLGAQWSNEIACMISGLHKVAEPVDLREEANAALAILGEMFGDKEEWDGRESTDGTESLEKDEAREDEMHVDEVIPRDFEVCEGRNIGQDKGKGKEKIADDDDSKMEEGPPSAGIEAPAETAGSAAGANLKALFAPREEASFSLLDHLDLELDLELDTNILGLHSSAPQENHHKPDPVLPASHVAHTPAATSTKARSRLTLDPSQPLLFPLPDSLPHSDTPPSQSTTRTAKHGTSACFLFPFTTPIRGLHSLPPSSTFTRSPQDTPESIRERWEKDKASLTREWKKAWREARGNRRGRAGAGGDVGGGY